MGRERAIGDARKDAEKKDMSRFYWVDLKKMERLGIESFRPVQDSNFIAIIPPRDDEEFYAREIYRHDNIGINRHTFICLKETKDVKTGEKWGKSCPICEKAQRLADAGAEDDRVAKYRPGRRFLFFIVDVSDLDPKTTTKQMEAKDKKILWYDGSKTFRDGITGASKDKRSGALVDVSNPDTGFTVLFDKIGKKLNTKYESFELEARSPIPDSWLEIPEYDDVLKLSTYEEMAVEVSGVPSEDGEQGEEESTGTRSRRRRNSASDVDVDVDGAPDDNKVEEAAEPTTTRRPRSAPKEDTSEKEPEQEAERGSTTEVDDIKARIRKKKEEQ